MESTAAPTFFGTVNTTWYDSRDGYDNHTDSPMEGGMSNGPGWVLPEWVKTVGLLLRLRLGICYVALFCNAVVLIFQMKLGSFRKTQYIFAVTLVVSDLLFTVCAFGQTYRYIHERVPIPPFYNGLYLSSNMMGWLSVIAVGVDRYLALVMIPLTYKFEVTIKKYALVILAFMIWSSLYAFIFTTYFEPGDTVVQYRGFVVLGSALLISSAIYVGMFTALRKSFRAINLGDRVQKVRFKQTRRLMLAFSMIIITNAICFIPSTFAFLIIYFVYQGQGLYLPRNIVILNVILTIRTLNLVLNPVIYWWQVLFRDISISCRTVRANEESQTGMSSLSHISHNASSGNLKKS